MHPSISEYHCTRKTAWQGVNKGASCGHAEQGYIQCHVRVKIASSVYGRWMLASPCRNASANGAAMSEGYQDCCTAWWCTERRSTGRLRFWLLVGCICGYGLSRSQCSYSDSKVVSNMDVHNRCDNLIKLQYLCSCPPLMQCMVQWFNGLFHPIITKSYNNKCNISHMREQMLDEDPAKREAWSAESSALIYTTGTLKLHII